MFLVTLAAKGPGFQEMEACSLFVNLYSSKRKLSLIIRVNRHTITRTKFQERDGTFNEFSVEFDNNERVCAGS